METGADIANLANLDLKLWMALACPVKGLEFDERTLALLDADGDGRIRAPEVIAATTWACNVLKDPQILLQAPAVLPLSAMGDSKPEGARLLAAAKRILLGHGQADATEITVEDAAQARTVLVKAKLNGDGNQRPEDIDDPLARALAADIIACLGGEPGVDGQSGVTKALADRFFEEAAAYVAWQDRASPDVREVQRLGEGTAAAASALNAVRSKIDDYFTRCRLAAFDGRAATAMNRPDEDWKALAAKDLRPSLPEIAAFPLARIEADRPLPLHAGLNPAWTDAMKAFRERVVAPLLGRDKTSITLAEWNQVVGDFSAYEAWLAGKAGTSVEALGLARVREILASDAKDRLLALLEADAAVAPEIEATVDVERLVRYVRDLNRLLNNFVSFTDFYARRKSVFQAGTLFIDGRACDLCLRVNDPVKHGLMAVLAKMYLLYCDCTRPSGETMKIVAAVTDGDADNLMVGRNGVFYDRAGRDGHKDRGEPRQPAPGVLVAVQEVPALRRGAGRHAGSRGRGGVGEADGAHGRGGRRRGQGQAACGTEED